MDQPVVDFTPSAGWRLRVAAARLHRRVGTAGLVGLLALTLGLLMGWDAWTRHQRFVREIAQAPTETTVSAVAALASPSEPVRVRWPTSADVPLLLARMERAAVQEGLGWPQADYRVTVATGDMPASLEVRCTLKGPYPAFRRFITALLLDQPTLTLRELGISRANAEASNVDAKLTLVVYLGGSASEDRP